MRSCEGWIWQEIVKGFNLDAFHEWFKEAGNQPDASDLEYLHLERGLGENLLDYLAADFRVRADAFFDANITISHAQDAYIALITHLQMCSQ